eukprot:SAG11_NODE_78_length_17939_cov_10.236883_12_plen_147_part_00
MAPQLPGKEYFALEAKAIFEKIDDDGSEVIDLEEITEAIAETDINLSEEEIEAMVERIDDDDSGAIDLDEFTEWWLANKKERIALFGPLQVPPSHHLPRKLHDRRSCHQLAPQSPTHFLFLFSIATGEDGARGGASEKAGTDRGAS